MNGFNGSMITVNVNGLQIFTKMFSIDEMISKTGAFQIRLQIFSKISENPFAVDSSPIFMSAGHLYCHSRSFRNLFLFAPCHNKQ
jgi:hypothetical protein